MAALGPCFELFRVGLRADAAGSVSRPVTSASCARSTSAFCCVIILAAEISFSHSQSAGPNTAPVCCAPFTSEAARSRLPSASIFVTARWRAWLRAGRRSSSSGVAALGERGQSPMRRSGAAASDSSTAKRALNTAATRAQDVLSLHRCWRRPLRLPNDSRRAASCRRSARSSGASAMARRAVSSKLVGTLPRSQGQCRPPAWGARRRPLYSGSCFAAVTETLAFFSGLRLGRRRRAQEEPRGLQPANDQRRRDAEKNHSAVPPERLTGRAVAAGFRSAQARQVSGEFSVEAVIAASCGRGKARGAAARGASATAPARNGGGLALLSKGKAFSTLKTLCLQMRVASASRRPNFAKTETTMGRCLAC